MIEYLAEENRVLREQVGNRPLRLSDQQRRRLAAKGKKLGRRVLAQVASTVTPDTILRWHRRLIATKWTHARKGPGRPGVMREIRELVVRMARENPGWGYCRIQGALKSLGHRVAATTVRNVLRDHGIRPAPERPTSWRGFLKAHWGQVVGADFFTVEAWTPRGLKTFYVLFFLDLKSRRVHIGGLTRRPNDAFMVQAARGTSRFLTGKRFLILDRDTKFSRRFREAHPSGIQVIWTPIQASNANAHAERFVRSIKSECLDRMIWFGEQPLRKALFEYAEHYHTERRHQGLGNELIESRAVICRGRVFRAERLGGLLNDYRRAA